MHKASFASGVMAQSVWQHACAGSSICVVSRPRSSSWRLQYKDESMKKLGKNQGEPASALISKRIAELVDWRGETLGRMRKLIKEADPAVVEEWKWMGPRSGRTTASSAPVRRTSP